MSRSTEFCENWLNLRERTFTQGVILYRIVFSTVSPSSFGGMQASTFITEPVFLFSMASTSFNRDVGIVSRGVKSPSSSDKSSIAALEV